MSRGVINCAKQFLSHPFSRIKLFDQWAVDREPVLTSTTSAKIGKTAINRRDLFSVQIVGVAVVMSASQWSDRGPRLTDTRDRVPRKGRSAIPAGEQACNTRRVGLDEPGPAEGSRRAWPLSRLCCLACFLLLARVHPALSSSPSPPPHADNYPLPISPVSLPPTANHARRRIHGQRWRRCHSGAPAHAGRPARGPPRSARRRTEPYCQPPVGVEGRLPRFDRRLPPHEAGQPCRPPVAHRPVVSGLRQL